MATVPSPNGRFSSMRANGVEDAGHYLKLRRIAREKLLDVL